MEINFNEEKKEIIEEKKEEIKPLERKRRGRIPHIQAKDSNQKITLFDTPLPDSHSENKFLIKIPELCSVCNRKLKRQKIIQEGDKLKQIFYCRKCKKGEGIEINL